MENTPRTDKAYFAKGATMYSMAQEMKLLEKELEELQKWKAKTLEGESQWDAQAVGEAIGLTLGERIRPAILPYIRKLQGELSNAKARIRELLKAVVISDQDALRWREHCSRERKQLDELAEAITKYMDHHMRYGFVTAVEYHKVEQALAAVEGGKA